MSLLGSIFGATKSNEKKKNVESSLNDLFQKSLPERPHHTEFPPPRKNKTEQRTSEEPNNKRKKRKRKNDENTETIEPADLKEGTDAAQEATPSSNDVANQATKKEQADDRTIFVGNLPLDTTRKSLVALFKSCGKIESTRLRSVAVSGVKLPPERTGDQNLMRKVCVNTSKVDESAKSTAQGYVVFASVESVETALKLNNTMVQSKRLRVDHANPTVDSSRSVFVGNLPYQADEDSLQTHFETTMQLEEIIEGVRIVRDKDTMQCKGFGYVLFRDKSMVATALQKVTNTVYMKRQIRVQVCEKRTKRKDGNNATASFHGKRATHSSPSAKKSRVRGEKKHNNNKTLPHKKTSVSKRDAAQAKAGKRAKQIQKRISKGMGKARR